MLAPRPDIDANQCRTLVKQDAATRRISEGRMNSIMSEAQSISAYGPARSSVSGSPLEPQELQRMQAYWNATLFLSAGMIYLRDNPLLREPLKAEHVKRPPAGSLGLRSRHEPHLHSPQPPDQEI